jgi:hypothetical protein
VSESAADEQHAQPVVLAVAETAGNAAVELDEAVDRFGAAVVGTAGVEVGQERFAPLLEGLCESLDLGDRAGRQRGDDLLGDPPAIDRVLGLVRGGQPLGAQPRNEGLIVAFVGGDRAVEPCSLPVGELLRAAAQDRPDAIERVVLSAAVAVEFLLHAVSDFVDGLGAELDHVGGAEDRGGVLDAVLEVLAALLEPVAVGLPRPARHQVEQRRSGVAVLVGIRSTIPVSCFGPTATVLDRELRDVVLDGGHVQTVQTTEQVATGAVGGVVMAARSGTRRRLGQRRGPSDGLLGRS